MKNYLFFQFQSRDPNTQSEPGEGVVCLDKTSESHTGEATIPTPTHTKQNRGARMINAPTPRTEEDTN